MPELPLFAVRSEYVVETDQVSEQIFRPLTALLQPQLPANYAEELPAGEIANVEGTVFLLRDLAQKGWKGHLSQNGSIKVSVTLQAPEESPSKDSIRRAMESRRLALIKQSAGWIKHIEPKIAKYLVDGCEVDPLNIQPEFEVCETQGQIDIFRYCRYISSVPYSEYVGRRIHFLIRDANLPNKPVIGIAAIGSSLLQISSRDQWIGWHGSEMRIIKKDRIGSLMDLYVCVSLPPYSYLLGGKLVCYMMASNRVREAFRQKYESRPTLAKKRIIKDLVMLVTTSVYGKRSSQYNRISYNDQQLYIPVGETEGFGTLHIGDDSFVALRNVLAQNELIHSNKFGDGANWRFRVIRDGMNLLGFDADECLNHGHPRGVYVIPLARNAREYLRNETDDIDYFDYPLEEMIEHWRERWLKMRIQNIEVMEHVRRFRADSLLLSSLLQNAPEA
jgi:hypothetical protein